MKKFLLMAGHVFILVSLILFGCGTSTLDEVDEDSDTAVTSPFTVFFDEDGLADNWITDIVVDHIRNGVWCATFNGISFYSNTDSTWITFGAETDIPHMEVTTLAIDYLTATVWAGTVSGPASYSDTLWTAFAEIDSLVHRYITSIAFTSDGSLWFGTKGGVSRNSFYGWTSYTAASVLAGDDITSITTNALGDVWIGTASGISVFDGKQWTQYGAGDLPSTYVRVVYKGSDGTMWCGTSNGIAAFDGAAWTRYGTADGVPARGINDFVEDWNRTLWVATDGGAAKFSSGKWEKLNLPDVVSENTVTALAVDIFSGVIWIGTSNGLVRYTFEGIE